MVWLPDRFFQPSQTGAKWARKGRRWAGTRNTCPSRRRCRVITSHRGGLAALDTRWCTPSLFIRCSQQTRAMIRMQWWSNTGNRRVLLTRENRQGIVRKKNTNCSNPNPSLERKSEVGCVLRAKPINRRSMMHKGRAKWNDCVQAHMRKRVLNAITLERNKKGITEKSKKQGKIKKKVRKSNRAKMNTIKTGKKREKEKN